LKNKRIMLVNVMIPEESRIAVLEDDVLEELYLERTESESCVGNIYKGKIINIEPSLQAAFVDIGLPRNGFLHVSDVMPSLARNDAPKEKEGGRRRRSSRPLIQHMLKKGQEVIVQVTKHSLGQKGAALTTYLSLPGRYLVFMPGLHKQGVSKKIDNEEQRTKLKAILEAMKIPKEIGIIARTAASGQTKRNMNRDLGFLQRLWASIQKRAKKIQAPAIAYQESDFIIRAMRDIFSAEIDEVMIDSEAIFKKAMEFVKIYMPRSKSKLKLYEGSDPLFHQYNVEDQVETVYNKRVDLKCGGYIVIEQTEALVAIDVNSGSYHGKSDPERAALEINLDAAREIARQIRLRDLGGMLVCDFIDMREQSCRNKVEQALSKALERDRARRRMLKISRFGLIEMTRQRMRSSVERSVFDKCPSCKGRGYVKSAESMAISLLRELRVYAGKSKGQNLTLSVHPKVEEYLQNRKRVELTSLEQSYEVHINIFANYDFGLEEFHVEK